MPAPLHGDGAARGVPDAPLPPWVVPALRLISGSVQVAQSAGRCGRSRAQGSRRQPAEAPANAGAKAANRPAPPLVRVFGKLHLHPTTVLGLQAVWRPVWRCWWHGC